MREASNVIMNDVDGVMAYPGFPSIATSECPLIVNPTVSQLPDGVSGTVVMCDIAEFGNIDV